MSTAFSRWHVAGLLLRHDVRKNAFIFANLKAAIKGVRQHEISNAIDKDFADTVDNENVDIAHKKSVSDVKKKSGSNASTTECAKDRRSQYRRKQMQAHTHPLLTSSSATSTDKGQILMSTLSLSEQHLNGLDNDDFDTLDSLLDDDSTGDLDMKLAEHQDEDLLLKPYPSTLFEKIVEESSESDSTNTEEDLENVHSS